MCTNGMSAGDEIARLLAENEAARVQIMRAPPARPERDAPARAYRGFPKLLVRGGVLLVATLRKLLVRGGFL